MEKREQVFVSSTYVDLREERQEVIQTLLEADCIPAGMELFPASSDEKWSLIQRVIDNCDYYVVVIGGRYGSMDEERGISFTEMEFDYAVAKKKPVMAFLHGDPGKIPGDKLDLDPNARSKLDSFRMKAEKRMVKYWSSPQELGGQVAKSLIQLRRTQPAEGWVRASNVMTPEVEREIAELRARVSELTRELETRSSPTAINLEGLAHGTDQYEGTYWLWYWTREQVESGQLSPAQAKTHMGTFLPSWDALFYSLGPYMLDECTQEALDDELDAVAESYATTGGGGTMPNNLGRIRSIRASRGMINDVIVQFFSLGLIQRSERRRAVSDKNTYWTLTEGGRNTLMRLRAQRRDKSLGDREMGADESDGTEPKTASSQGR